MTESQPRRLEDFQPLTPAEQAVLDGLDTGRVIVLGDGTRPAADAGPARQIRARFLRWVALGCADSQHRLPEKGLRLAGALIVSDGDDRDETPGLDLEGCTLAHDLALVNCRFADTPLLRRARVQNLFLGGSALPGLRADRLSAEGDVLLRGAEAKGEVRLLGARIGGDLSCAGATLSNPQGKAFDADGLSVEGSVFLRDAEAKGEVWLLGARIGGDLDCTGATLSNLEGPALTADGLSAKGSCF